MGIRDRGSLGHVIGAQQNMRIGFAAMNGTNNNTLISEMNESPLTGNKVNLLNNMYANAVSGGTPIRTRLQGIGEYFRCATPNLMNANGGPGEPNTECPVLGAPEGNCQQNYTLLITDGAWSGTVPSFGTGSPDPDRDGIQTLAGGGTSNFDGGIFAGCDPSSTSGCDVTLADVAMYYYETDLHPTLLDEVPTTARDRELADDTAFGSNPDIMHQHMSTFVIGFGVEGSFTDADIPADFTQSFDWGDPTTEIAKIDDLRHAALNGRGGYLDAGNPQELQEALEAAFEEFATAVGTASAVSFNSQEITQGSLVFRAFYNVRENTGDLIAQTFDETGQITGTEWSAAEVLDTMNFDLDREIITYDPVAHSGVPFRPCVSASGGASYDCTSSTITDEQFNTLVELPA
ncbi:MAG: hypothetical protein HUJ31_02095, partial [Pseudomonadales bacterium]|nr:hypothetical protein [Pseudomonadales bacterium]